MSSIVSTPIQDFLPVKSHRDSFLISFFLICFYVLFSFFVIFLFLGYLITIDKIKLSNPSFQTTISSIIFHIPYIPKTSKYLLTSSWLAHQKTGHNSFIVTVSVASKELKNIIGSNNDLDLQIKSLADFSTPNNPRFSFAVNNSDNLSSEINKINQQWKLKDSYTFLPASNQSFQEIYNILIKDGSFQNKRLNKEYRLVAFPSTTQIEKINHIMVRDFNIDQSQKIQDLNIVFWLDAHSYLTNKILVSFNLVSTDKSLPISNISLAINAYLSEDNLSSTQPALTPKFLSNFP
jgi:hypothetical protein